GHLVGARHVLAHGEHEESRIGALYGHGPAGFVVFLLQAPILGVLEADARVVKFCHHGPPPCRSSRRFARRGSGTLILSGFRSAGGGSGPLFFPVSRRGEWAAPPRGESGGS